MFDLAHVAAWAIFLGVVLFLLAIDLFVLHRKPHEISMREALIGASIPALIALLFAGAIYVLYQYKLFHLGDIPPNLSKAAQEMWPDTGNEAVLMYLTGYIIEISLSADNVFLFVVLMNFFIVPKVYQHRVLFWGVLGALIMRAAMIIGGSALIQRFGWIILVFGAFLLFTGLKMLFSGDSEPDPDKSLAVRLARKFLRVTPDFHGKYFFVRVVPPKPKIDSAGSPSDGVLDYAAGEGRLLEATPKMPVGLYATPLFLVLICVEVTDVIFAVDSIPAVFAVTHDPFIVFTSNIFAILGLRSLYFLLAGSVDKFHLLKYGLALVLTFVGIKMLMPWFGTLYRKWQAAPEDWYNWHIPIPISLAVIIVVLLGSIVLSLAYPKPHKAAEPEEIHDEDDKPGKLV